MKQPRLPVLTHQQMLNLYRKNVERGQLIGLAVTEWTPPPTTAAELIERIQRKEPK